MTPIDPKFKSAPRPGLQGNLTFDNKSVSANPVLFKEVRQILSGIHGMEGAGGERAQSVKTGTSYIESRGYTQTKERDTALRRLENQVTDKLNSAYGSVAQDAGMSVPEYLQTQGIHGVQEVGSGDDRRMTAFKKASFRKISYNPLMSSNDKANRAAVKSAGFAYDNSGANENRRGTALVPAAIAQEIEDRTRKLSVDLESGLANTGDLEGSYLTKAQKFHVRNKKKTIEKSVSAGNIYSEDPALVERVRSEMIEADQMRSLKKNLKKDLEDEGLITPTEKEKKTEESFSKKAMAGGMLAVNKLLSVVTDLKSLFASAVGYLRGIASEIGGLKQTSATLGISMGQAMALKNMGSLNTVSGGTANTFTDSASALLNITSDPSKLSGIKWDSTVLQGQAGLIKPIVDEAAQMKLKPKELMYKLYNKLGAEYFNPKLSETQRRRVRMKQLLALQGLPGGEAIAQGYQVATDTADMYGLAEGDNRYRMMQRVESNSNNHESRATMFETVGLTRDNSYGSKRNQRELNDFDRFTKALEDMIKQLTMVHLDDITRAMSELALALLKFLAWFDKDGTAAKLAEVMERRMKFTAKDDRKELTRNMTIVDRALRKELKAVGYTGKNAEDIIQEGISAKTPEEIMERLLFREDLAANEDAVRKLFLLNNKNRKMHRELSNFDNSDPKDRTSIDTYNLKDEGRNNSDENIILYNYLKNKAAVQPGEFEGLLKNVGKIKDQDLIQRSKAPLSDDQLRQLEVDRYKNKQYNYVPQLKDQVLDQLNLDPLINNTYPNKALASAGSSLGKEMQEKQTVAIENTLRLLMDNKEIVLKNDIATDDKKRMFYANIT